MSPCVRTLLLALVALAAFGGVSPAKAHDTRPLYVEIAEKSTELYSVSWKVPISVAATNVPNVALPSSCKPIGPAVGTASARSRSYTCSTDLSGESVSISYPRFNPSISTLMHLRRLSGESHSEVLPPDRSEWIVPDKENIWRVARDYTVLGIEHILEGYDHLLFIVCLILLAGTFRRMLVTITGFTIAHSVTLAMAALGLVNVPVAAVEASVALSIVFVATELARDDRHTLTWRHPIAVSSTFGLLHGFGFAAVLSEIGLPQTEVPAALLFFNVGVELGQLAFIFLAVGTILLVRRLVPNLRDVELPDVLRRVQLPVAYVVGTLALFWTFDRISQF